MCFFDLFFYFKFISILPFFNAEIVQNARNNGAQLQRTDIENRTKLGWRWDSNKFIVGISHTHLIFLISWRILNKTKNKNVLLIVGHIWHTREQRNQFCCCCCDLIWFGAECVHRQRCTLFTVKWLLASPNTTPNIRSVCVNAFR